MDNKIINKKYGQETFIKKIQKSGYGEWGF